MSNVIFKSFDDVAKNPEAFMETFYSRSSSKKTQRGSKTYEQEVLIKKDLCQKIKSLADTYGLKHTMLVRIFKVTTSKMSLLLNQKYSQLSLDFLKGFYAELLILTEELNKEKQNYVEISYVQKPRKPEDIGLSENEVFESLLTLVKELLKKLDISPIALKYITKEKGFVLSTTINYVMYGPHAASCCSMKKLLLLYIFIKNNGEFFEKQGYYLSEENRNVLINYILSKKVEGKFLTNYDLDVPKHFLVYLKNKDLSKKISNVYLYEVYKRALEL